MDILALIFFSVSAWVLWTVSRRWAPLVLLVSCCYMTMGQGVHLGPISLPIYRLLLAVGLFRVISRKEKLAGELNGIDKLMIAWGAWVLLASFFHEDIPGAGPIYSCGVIFNLMLTYFLVRIWCRDFGELTDLIKFIAVMLVPVAAEMALEKFSGKNLFAVFGGVPLDTLIREGKLRAQGPFRHPILAGTVGAVCFPLMIAIWKNHRRHAVFGMCACVLMVFASASSGPIMSLLFGICAVCLWRFRAWTKTLRMGAFVGYLVLAVVMTKPPYFLLSRIDVTGGSTGWHRAFLIEQTFKHFSEWWLFGTDYTLKWMPDQGVGAGDGRNTDITNYYITFAVLGGLLSMLLIIAILLRAFRWVGQLVRDLPDSASEHKFVIWCLGAALFAHAATSISVSYFDQSMMFFWLTVAVISSMHSAAEVAHFAQEPQPEESASESVDSVSGTPLDQARSR
jgi:hypothetical protein